MATNDVVEGCHLCGSTGTVPIAGYRYLRRVTSDCRPWGAGGRLMVCGGCGGVSHPLDRAWHDEAASVYSGYTIYHQSGGVEQSVFDMQTGVAATRSVSLLEYVRQRVTLPERGAWLDVGCGNGAMLRACSAVLPGWRLMGTELDGRYRQRVESIPGVEHMHAGYPWEVGSGFDVISLVHVLEHVPQPGAMLSRLVGMLNPGGVLLVEVPDHATNPFDLVIVDHCSHFTALSLCGVLDRAGMADACVVNDALPKELTAIWQRGRRGVPTPVRGRDADPLTLANRTVAWLERVGEWAIGLATNQKLGLFGTSIAATWLAGGMLDRIGFFVDEDPSRIGGTHMGKPIVKPGGEPEGSRVLLLLPPALAHRVAGRLSGKSAEGVSYLVTPNF
ncbi:MAG: methyltransferase domain-containing protein [Phycisphaera sp.]|nr:methyltransferase domain-containing protein [Phycisphaera sp.]